MQADFTSQDYYRDPAASIEKLRQAGPVIEIRFPIVGKVWVTTTYKAAGRRYDQKGDHDPQRPVIRGLGCR
jgi:cytochrome P450 PksS